MEWRKLRGGVLSIAERSSTEEERNKKKKKKKERGERKPQGRRKGGGSFSSIIFIFGWIKNWSYTLQEVRDFSSLVISLFGAMEWHLVELVCYYLNEYHVEFF